MFNQIEFQVSVLVPLTSDIITQQIRPLLPLYLMTATAQPYAVYYYMLARADANPFYFSATVHLV